MKNVVLAVEGDDLVITINMSKVFGPSKSGKTTMVASTEGIVAIPGRPELLGLNMFKYEPKAS